MNSVLVTGSSRGIGLEFVKQLAQKSKLVIACCRSPENADDLGALVSHNKNIEVIALDVTNEESIKKGYKKVSDLVNDSGLTCLINNAGIAYFQDSINQFSQSKCAEIYSTNAIGPALMAKNFLPLVKKAAMQSSQNNFSASRAAIINISAMLGSISETKIPGKIEYKMSKAALNMLTKSLALELKSNKILVASLCPGWVKTDMGGPKATHTVETAVSNLLKVIEQLNESSNGNMINWDGRVFQP